MAGSDRGQAFTLEGVIGAIVVMTALVVALQSIVVTPTTGGAVDETARGDLRQQAEDVLAITDGASPNDLSTLVRNWSASQRSFAGAVNPRIGYGPRPPPGDFGEILNRTFTQRSYRYNVQVAYRPENVSDGAGSASMVYRGDPSPDAVVASRTVTLYDNQTLTAPNASRNVRLWQYGTNRTADAGYYPIPDAVDGPIYNVVEVRVIVW